MADAENACIAKDFIAMTEPDRGKIKTQWAPGGPCLRVQIRLEDASDLIADLERGFAALAATR